MILQGNYQELRNCFYFFREKYHKQIIRGRLRQTDIEFFNTTIKTKEEWSLADAHRLYNILKPFGRELTKHGFNFNGYLEPKIEDQRKYTAKVATRIESVTYQDSKFVVYFNYSKAKVADIKKIQGRRYIPNGQYWEVPLSQVMDVRVFAERYGISISDSCERVMYDFKNNLEQSYDARRVELDILLKMELYDYQTVGVDYSVRVQRAWIADQMGLGKSSQAIAYGVKINKPPYIIICPKSLRLNWKNEIEMWTNKKAIIADHKNMRMIHRFVEMGQVDFLITNYEGIKSFFVEEAKQTQRGYMIKLNGRERLFNGVIIDESHELRNIKAKRTKTIYKLCSNYEYRLLLTGSPFVNRVADLATQLHLLGHLGEFGGYRKFLNDYESSKYVRNREGNKKKLEELNKHLRSLCMIRREKHQVLKQLPDKVRQIISIDIDNRGEYQKAIANFAEYLQEKGITGASLNATLNAEILTKIMYLRKICLRGKIAAAKEYISNILEQGEKLIVFCWHLETIELLREHFPRLMEISGNVNDTKIDINKQNFQSDNPQHNLIVITYKRGGVGHTLTAASNVLFMELGWNPKDQEQAEDRAHRIGQEDNVTCHYFIGNDTVEEWMYNLIESKRKNMKKSLNSTEEIQTNIQKDLILKLVNNANKDI